MSSLQEERAQDGHTLLLIETEKESRTFSDYPNLYTCLQTIVNMYEEELDAMQKEGGDLDDFMKWLDSFYMIKLLIFDKEISRYRMTERDGLKKLFEENPENGSYKPSSDNNGAPEENITNSTLTSVSLNHVTLNMTSPHDADDDESDGGPEDWDE